MKIRLFFFTAAVVLLAANGCSGGVGSGRAAAGGSPSASSTGLTQRYVLRPEVCQALDFTSLEAVFPKASLPARVREWPVTDQERSSGRIVSWGGSGNFLSTGGVDCSLLYGAGQESEFLLSVGLATYETAVGSRLAYKKFTDADSEAGSLPVGVELVARELYESYAVYVCDGSLFAEIQVLVMGDGSLAEEGLARTAPPAIDTFANHVIERLRADFTAP